MKLIPWRESGSPLMRSDMETWFDELFGNGRQALSHLPQALRRTYPALNLAENEKEFLATLELPGMDEKDIEVQRLGDRLTVSGERKWEQEKKEKDFYRVESQFGAFRRDIPLPDGLSEDPAAIVATFHKGVLEIRIPKAEPKQSTRVKVKVN